MAILEPSIEIINKQKVQLLSTTFTTELQLTQLFIMLILCA